MAQVKTLISRSTAIHLAKSAYTLSIYNGISLERTEARDINGRKIEVHINRIYPSESPTGKGAYLIQWYDDRFDTAASEHYVNIAKSWIGA